ncbi:MAG: hypothetical protein U0869_23320 [Chloroflexota bacterium]
MPSPRRARLAALAASATLLALLPTVVTAQDGPVVYGEGAAQVLARVGTSSLDDFTLVSGTMDPATATLTLVYQGTLAETALTISAPNVPGISEAPPKPPRTASVIYVDLHGMNGAVAACLVAWNTITPTEVSGSFGCPNERTKARKGKPVNLLGTFSARAAPADGIATDTSSLPVHALGATVTAEGQSVTPLAIVDLASACVKASGPATPDCGKGQQPVPGAYRAITLRMCVDASGPVAHATEKRGASRTFFAGTPGALLPVGLPASTRDPALTAKAMPRTIDPETCGEGYVLAGTQGPMLAWTPPNGAPAVVWTLDPSALPPTADDAPTASTAPGSPAPGSGAVPAGSATYTGGAADLTSDNGGTTAYADDLVLTEGSFVSDGAGSSVVHLAFAGADSTLTIDVPAPAGSFTWDAGAAVANQGVAWTIGGSSVDAATSGCQVEIDATDLGGVQGSYACTVGGSATGSGSFIANP